MAPLSSVHFQGTRCWKLSFLFASSFCFEPSTLLGLGLGLGLGLANPNPNPNQVEPSTLASALPKESASNSWSAALSWWCKLTRVYARGHGAPT